MTNQVKVGLFTTASILIFILGFYFLKGVNLFERSNSYYAVFDRVDGLYKSNIVIINGFQVGRVGDMKLNPETGKIIVKLDLAKGLKVPDSDSTLASLLSTDFLGTKEISLTLGKSDRYLKDGDTIHTFFKKDLSEQIGSQIDPIMTGVNKMVPVLDSTVSSLNWLFDQRNPKGIYTTKGEIDQALAKLNVILDANAITLQTTLKNLESITSNIEKNNNTIGVVIKNAGSITDSIQQANLKQTIDNLDNAVIQLKGVLASVNEGHGTLGKMVKDDGLYNKLDSAIVNFNILAKDIKARPYRYINISVLGSKKHDELMEKRYNESGK